MILKDIDYLHFSKSKTEFSARKLIVFKKWDQNPNLNDFKEYFIKQWIDNPMQQCNNWQIFHTPPGLETTNNPIETSINKSNLFL